MVKNIDLRMEPEIWGDEPARLRMIAKFLNVSESEIQDIIVSGKSIDARQKKVVFQLSLSVYLGERFQPIPILPPVFPSVKNSREVVIVGTGPAGLFAGLEAIKNGWKPILIERGKDVRRRIFDLRSINVHQTVDPDSNYAFGEGGAGTYSDGKLYTRSGKRGNIRDVYETLVAFGANPEILVEAHPHIGTNKLPGIIANIRSAILAAGGEIHFDTKFVDLILSGKVESGRAEIRGILVRKVGDDALGSGSEPFSIPCRHLILATGHSGRDVFHILAKKNILLEPKPIAIGVRIEHLQSLIDEIQYKRKSRGEFLPPAPYSLVKQVGGRGVYSFCMCPGGVIAPCATEPDEIVTNGWSSSGRGRPTANSGIVVELKLEDIPGTPGDPLRVMKFQRSIETKAWEIAERTQRAPAQRLMDFIAGKQSSHLPKTSYPPGITNFRLDELLPKLVSDSLKAGFKLFGEAKPGYLTNEAILHAPETRTSSPIRIPRDKDSLEHPQVRGLYPCGEGAGYAGGIVSAALDGLRVAKTMAERVPRNSL
jgi:uncharacterized FAD-dependent dehydrogenase